MSFIVKLYGNFCCYCGKRISYPLHLTTEHLIPKSKGGSDDWKNKRPCCQICNGWRSNKSYLAWSTEVQILITKRQPYPPFFHVHDLDIILENILYWKSYVETGATKLLRRNLHASKVPNFY